MQAATAWRGEFAIRSRVQRALALGLLLAAGPASAGTPLGLWINAKQTVAVRVAPCDSGLCARIVWLAKPYRKDGALKRDGGRPWCGLTVVHDWQPAVGAAWAAGSVYAPASGTSYRGRIRLTAADTLAVRGYKLHPLIGRTLVWRRLAAAPGGCPHAPDDPVAAL